MATLERVTMQAEAVALSLPGAMIRWRMRTGVIVFVALGTAALFGGVARAGCENSCTATAAAVNVTPPLDCATFTALPQTCDCSLLSQVRRRSLNYPTMSQSSRGVLPPSLRLQAPESVPRSKDSDNTIRRIRRPSGARRVGTLVPAEATAGFCKSAESRGHLGPVLSMKPVA
jgi:hypothetical protein